MTLAGWHTPHEGPSCSFVFRIKQLPPLCCPIHDPVCDHQSLMPRQVRTTIRNESGVAIAQERRCFPSPSPSQNSTTYSKTSKEGGRRPAGVDNTTTDDAHFKSTMSNRPLHSQPQRTFDPSTRAPSSQSTVTPALGMSLFEACMLLWKRGIQIQLGPSPAIYRDETHRHDSQPGTATTSHRHKGHPNPSGMATSNRTSGSQQSPADQALALILNAGGTVIFASTPFDARRAPTCRHCDEAFISNEDQEYHRSGCSDCSEMFECPTLQDQHDCQSYDAPFRSTTPVSHNGGRGDFNNRRGGGGGGGGAPRYGHHH